MEFVSEHLLVEEALLVLDEVVAFIVIRFDLDREEFKTLFRMCRADMDQAGILEAISWYRSVSIHHCWQFNRCIASTLFVGRKGEVITCHHQKKCGHP